MNYEHRCHQKHRAVAKVAAARKLAVRLFWMLRNQRPYPTPLPLSMVQKTRSRQFVHRSGGKQRMGSISKRGNRILRTLLVDAAQSLVRFDPEFRNEL